MKNPCSICKFRVHKNHKAIFCNICHLWTHLKCTPLSLSEYNDLTHFHDDWYCPSCLSDTFPFNHFDSDTDFYFKKIACGGSRNLSQMVQVDECQDTITTQLETCHLSKSGLSEAELILSWAGHFDP